MSDSDPNTSIVIGSQLRRARQLLLLAPEEVAQEINVSPEAIVSWEAAQTHPSLKQLEKLAELYGREIDYFLRETPAPPERIAFRGKPGQSLKSLSKETRIVLAKFDELCRTAFEFENLLERRQEVRLPKFTESVHPEIVAQRLRKELHVDHGPLADLRIRLEGRGVRIFELPVPEDAFSGFSFWHVEYGPCILLNGKEPKGRRNFTLAHELAHLLYSHGSSLCYIPLRFGESIEGRESKADQFAIELLLPQSGVVEDFTKRGLTRKPSERELGQMASKWGASVQALGYRLENLGKIEEGLIDKIVESKPTYLRRPKTPTWQRQLGKRFVETSIEAYQEGLISSGKLAHALRIPIRKALEMVEQMGN